MLDQGQTGDLPGFAQAELGKAVLHADKVRDKIRIKMDAVEAPCGTVCAG